jgi:alpha-1,2-mannosyltransferase
VTDTKWRRILVAALLLASAAEFSVRGPARIARGMGWNDFLSPYIQAKAWVQGKDPYAAPTLVALWPADNPRPDWVDADALSGALERKRGMPTPYPLTSLVILSPLSLLSWSIAMPLWIVLSVAAVVLAPFGLISICGCRLVDLRTQLFLAIAFALAPLHTGIGTANPAMLAVSLTVGTVWAARSGRTKTAGVLLAIAICLKPTVAGGLLLYYLIRRQWKVAGTATAVAAAIASVGVLRLGLAGVPWLASYFENANRIFSSGSLADFTRPGTIRFNMVNAQVLFYSLLGNASSANLVAWCLAVGLLACWLWFCWRRRTPSGLLEISAIAVVSLISVYHRFYDAALLMWPLAWSLLLGIRRSISLPILATIAPFLVPGPTLLADLAVEGRIPAGIAHGWWWDAVILPHEIWALIVLAFLLLYYLSRSVPEESFESARESTATAVRPGPAPS